MTSLRHPCSSLLLLLAVTASGCNIWHGTGQQAMQWHVELPPDAAAAIISAALSVDLHAEPIAPASGAPVTPCEHGYRMEWTGDARGNWLPIASHRLVLRAGRNDARVEQIELAKRPLTGFRSRTTRRVLVEVATAGTGCTLRMWAPTSEFERLAAALQRTLLLACSLDGSGPGLAEANLAAWRLTRLLAAANQTSTPDRRGNLMRRAARQPTAPSWLFHDLAQMAASSGQFAKAANYVSKGMLVETNALARARFARLAHRFALRTMESPDMRARALDMMRSGDIETAEKLLHSARRADSRPSLDYRLLGKLHRRRGDKMAALAAELLSREYDADRLPDRRSRGLALDRGITEQMRWISSRQAVRASTRLRGSERALATPPR